MADPTNPAPFAREVIDVPVADELGESFLAYSLSVITSRAIPDVKDGLKPVQRRILYSMREMGLRPDRPHRKCAHVVGDVMAKYHPHGDSAIYDTLVRLGQDFSRPVTLVDPQGNFGSLDDPPAAYRYTECRLTPAAIDLLGEIDEDTVDFRPTYDGETEEPAYLPAVLPNLLVNGTSGIAVGMATSMPTHNLIEVAEAIKLVMTKRRPKPTIDELMACVPGPDFPSGGFVIADGIREAYETGRGSVRMRARAKIVDVTRSRQGIEVTELPYLVGPERVVAKIKELIHNGRIQGISNVNDESDRKHGLKIVIEAKTGVNVAMLLEKLYKLTPLEETFGINNVVLVDGVPTTLGLYDLCHYYIEHRLDVIVRRSECRLRKAKDRLHIVEGLLIAIDNIDLVVRLIRTSKNGPEARQRLMDELGLTQIQAEYVLDLQLRRLTALSYDELVEEKRTLLATIDDLEKLLASEQRRRTLVLKELGEVVDKYGTPRRSELVSSETLPDLEEMTEAAAAEVTDDPCVLSLSATGLIGREPIGTSRSFTPSRHDVIERVVVTSLQATVLAITSTGRCLHLTPNDLAEVAGRSRGATLGETPGAPDLERGERVVSLFTTDGPPLLLITASGVAKRVERDVLAGQGSGRPAIGLADGDTLVAAVDARDDAEVVMVSSDAQALRTPVDGISTQGAAARGVAGMKLKGSAKVVGAGLVADGAVVITTTDADTAKSTPVDEIPTKGRGTGGVRLTKFKHEKRLVFGWVGVPERTVMLVGQTDAPSRPDGDPQPMSIAPTRRDGPSSPTERRILAIGSIRW